MTNCPVCNAIIMEVIEYDSKTKAWFGKYYCSRCDWDAGIFGWQRVELPNKALHNQFTHSITRRFL